MTILQIQEADFDEWITMAIDLWPEEDPQEMPDILRTVQNDSRNANFICRSDDGAAMGFINLSIRSDYVEGSDTSPVGYIEGIYVKPEYRKSGVGRALVAFAENWARTQGCKEMGSDTYQENTQSREFHKKAGFTEAGIMVAFIKKI